MYADPFRNKGTGKVDPATALLFFFDQLGIEVEDGLRYFVEVNQRDDGAISFHAHAWNPRNYGDGEV